MTDNEKLIEEAAVAIDSWLYVYDSNPHTPRTPLAESIWAVFEKAHTPTDHERSVLLDELEAWQRHTGDAALGNLLRRVGSAIRRSEVPEPNATCPKCGVSVTDQTPSTFYTHHDETCGGPLEEPQGEPSDQEGTG